MSLEAILEGIQASGEEEIKAIQLESQVRAQELLEQTRATANQIGNKNLNEGLLKTKFAQTRILQRARMEALDITEAAFQDLLEEVLSKAQAQLSFIRSDARYPVILSHLIHEAVDELKPSLQEGETIHLLADPRDQDLLEELLKDYPINIQADYQLDCWGGVIVSSEDEKVRIINTLKARLKRATATLQQRIIVLFKELPAKT